MAALAAVGAAVCYAVAVVLQQRAAVAVPAERSLRLGLLSALVRRPLWLAGVAADFSGYGLEFLALSRGSLILVAPLLMSSLLFALPLGAALTGERLRRSDWVGAALLVAGLSAFLVEASPRRGRAETSGLAWALLLGSATAVIALLLAAARGPQAPRRARFLAAAAGVNYALTAALTKATSHLLGHGIAHTATRWEPYGLAVVGVSGVLLSQSALQAGALAASLPTLTASDPLASIAVGALAFGESLRARGAGLVVAVGALLAMLVGAVALSRSPLIQRVRAAPP